MANLRPVFLRSVLGLGALGALLFAPYGCGSDSGDVTIPDGGEGGSTIDGSGGPGTDGSIGFGDGSTDDGSGGGDGSTGGGDGSTGGGDGSTGGGHGDGGALCEPQGAACANATDCCTVSCIGNKCGAQCTGDTKACTSDAQCCSGQCVAGTGGAKTCAPLNTTCKTAGNACTANSQCCSQLCSGGFCALNSSFCTQTGDTCAADTDCCGGNCVKETGKTLGTCTAITGASNCHDGQDGTVCGDCNGCCSRLCAPYAPTGVKVCQPANGCHVDGDLCRKDSDCCGGDPDSGLPGAGNVTCEIPAGKTVGICRNAKSCNPEGNVCHYQNYACSNSSSQNDCCDHLGVKTDCTLDDVGVPRCHVVGNPADGDAGVPCRDTNQTCAFSGDCCNGAKCVPGPNGELTCAPLPAPDAGPVCQQTGKTCTVTGDCCVGLNCIVPPGGTNGTCGVVTPPPGSDAGTNDAGGVACAQYGQACGNGVTCCDGVPCSGAGICEYTIN